MSEALSAFSRPLRSLEMPLIVSIPKIYRTCLPHSPRQLIKMTRDVPSVRCADFLGEERMEVWEVPASRQLIQACLPR